MKKTVLLLALLFFPTLLIAAPEFEEDLHYSTVVPPQPGGEGDRVQVLEFFWYACSHCYHLEPHIEEWLKNKQEQVDFVRVPVIFNRPGTMLHAKTFYALELMGVSDEIHHKIFHAMHEEGQRLSTQEEMEQFLEKQGVDLEEYRNAESSFAVQTQVRRAKMLAQRFDIRSVPSVAVDGKFLTGGLVGTTLMQVVDYLIDRARQEKVSQAAK